MKAAHEAQREVDDNTIQVGWRLSETLSWVMRCDGARITGRVCVCVCVCVCVRDVAPKKNNLRASE